MKTFKQIYNSSDDIAVDLIPIFASEGWDEEKETKSYLSDLAISEGDKDKAREIILTCLSESLGDYEKDLPPCIAHWRAVDNKRSACAEKLFKL